MTLCKHIPMRTLEVWQPRWHDRRALIACYKVAEHNKVIFPKAPTLPGVYYLSGKTIRKYKKESNGTIDCYAVPIDELTPLEYPPHCEHEY